MNKELVQAIKTYLTPEAVATIAEAIAIHCQGKETAADSEARWFARGLRVCVLDGKAVRI